MTSDMTLSDLFHETLKDIYFAEKNILMALPKMAEAAHSQDLRKAFETHRDQTMQQVERLEKVFQIIGKSPQGKTCEAIQGLIAEGEEIIEEFNDAPALDAGLISSGQAVEHYEIARYGTLKAWATELGHDDAVDLLDETLQEEIETDKILTDLAEDIINEAAQKRVA